MASWCVSAISALHPSIAAVGLPQATNSGFRSDIADTHLEAMLYILHIIIYIYTYLLYKYINLDVESDKMK